MLQNKNISNVLHSVLRTDFHLKNISPLLYLKFSFSLPCLLTLPLPSHIHRIIKYLHLTPHNVFDVEDRKHTFVNHYNILKLFIVVTYFYFIYFFLTYLHVYNKCKLFPKKICSGNGQCKIFS